MPTEIPIQPNISAQTFDISLDDISYNLTVKWNSRSTVWTLDIKDENGNDIILGISLKLGAWLLKPFNLDIGELIIVDDTATNTEANLTNISISTRLVYFTNQEVAEIEEFLE